MVAIHPFFKIRRIEVVSNKFVSKECVLKVLSDHRSSNLVFFSRRRMRNRLKEQIPQLSTVHFHKTLLSHTLVVQLVEHVPFATIVAYPYTYIINGEGVVLNVDEKGRVNDFPEFGVLPIITGLDPQKAFSQGRLSRRYIHLVKGSIRSLIKMFGNEGVKFNLSDLKDIRVLSKDLIEIRLGSTMDFEKKLYVLRAIMEFNASSKEKMNEVDVRYPDYPTVRYHD
ncbi:MAG: FtsQ-type POTRA domain-containing protein [Candidatus Margulisiibacteriota bacterium]